MSKIDGIRRGGFTLIELLVVLALIVALAGMALLVVPAALERDRTVDAVAQVQNWLQIARARALRDGRPHGVRFILEQYPVPQAPPNNLILISRSAQYIEMPPVLLPNPNPTIDDNSPYVEFLYTYDAQGQITYRRCCIVNVHPSLITVTPGQPYILVLPTLPSWHYIDRNPNPISNGIEVTLRHYPDEQLGAAGPPAGTAMTDIPIFRTYHFGLYRSPQALLGEGVMLLPERTCIDFTPGVSQPDGAAAFTDGRDYDLLFIPSGQLSPYGSHGGAGQVFLWIRDPNLPEGSGRMNPSSYGGVTAPAFLNALRQGGEQMIIAIKASSGAIIAAPVHWPESGGNTDLYWFARQALLGQ